MPKPPLIAPPLPTAPFGVWWAVVMLKYGPSPAAKFCNYYCMTVDKTISWTTPQAVLIALNFFQQFGFALSTLMPSNWFVGPTSCWAWDDVQVHSGSWSAQISGALPFAHRMAERPALIIRRGIEAGKPVLSRWYGPPLSSAHCTPSYQFTPLGRTAWRGFASNLLTKPTFNGSRYQWVINRSTSTGSLLPVLSTELFHQPAFLRKRNRDEIHVRDYDPPPNFPTTLG